MARTVYDYGRFAWCYEWIAGAYSLGAIARVKASQVRNLRAGERVLYVGVGAGEDALMASRAGVRLTCLDASPAMLGRLRARLESQSDGSRSIEFVLGDLFEYDPTSRFDVVIANFVLNLYAEPQMLRAMDRLRSWLAPRGQLMIADFTYPNASWSWLASLYYRPVNCAAWMLGLCELHPIHDYARALESRQLELVARERAGLLGVGPPFYESLTARALSD